jgi:quinohemoprotein ethanol dehydrogenase
MRSALARPILRLSRLMAAIGVAVAAIVATDAAPSRNWTAVPSADFPLTGGNYWHQRYSALDRINTANVKNLGGAWMIHLEEGRPGGQLEGTPVVIDGVMYVTTGTRGVLAIDARTGSVKWRYRPQDSEGAGGGNKGVAVAEGKVFFGRRDAVLVALDQETGKEVWQTRLTSERGAYVSAPTVYYDGMVYVGTSGGDGGARGQMGAYDAKTGKEIWKFYTIPGRGDRFADTWEGDSYKNGGGGIWTSPTLDPDLGMVYVSIGNVGLRQYGAADRNPDFSDEGRRGGDNLFTGSVLALDLKTGKYRWHFQQVHHDIWHLDAGGPSVLADITYLGRPRKILMNPGKTGFLYILDRTNGTPLIGMEERPVPQESRMKTARTQPYPIGDPFVPLCPEPLGNFERGCLFSAYRSTPLLIAPGTAGGNTWAPMTYSPKTQLAYIPGTVFDSVFHLGADGPGRALQSTTFHPPGVRRSGTLTAMNPTTNRIVWQKKTKYPMGGGSGLLSTAGGLLFNGQPDGNLVAYDMKNGDELWRFQTGAGADAGVSTFEVAGEQYVAIMAGGNSVARSQRGDALWAFKLGGTVAQAAPPREPPTIEPDRPDR